MIAAVVVTYSAPPDLLRRCLEAITVAGGVDRVVLVDTGGSAVVGDPDVEVIRTPNRGYGAAANIGFRRASELGADRFVLLNDDVVVSPGWLAPLAAVLDDARRIGVAQPVLLTGDGATVNSLGVELDRYGAGSDTGRDGDPPSAHLPPSPIDRFTGGALMTTAGFLDATGGFDGRYFLYYEDVDLAERGRALGWSYRLVPASRVAHLGGMSTGTDVGRTRFLQERNRLWAAFRFAPPVTIGRAIGLSVRRLRHRPRAVHARALIAGVGGAPAALWCRARQRNRV